MNYLITLLALAGIFYLGFSLGYRKGASDAVDKLNGMLGTIAGQLNLMAEKSKELLKQNEESQNSHGS